MKSKNILRKNFLTIESNLDVYLTYIIEKPNKEYFATFEEYLAHENGVTVKTTIKTEPKIQKQFNLSENELRDLLNRINKIINLNKSLLKSFNMERYDALKLSVAELYNYNLKFYQESQGQDYLRGMHVCLTQTLFWLKKIDKELALINE